MTKRIVLFLLSVAVIAAAGLAGAALYGQASKPALAQTPESPAGYSPSRTITVIGQGTARLQPNIAQVSLGIETVAGTVSEAAKDNASKMKALLAALKLQGIADKDIQTTNYSISLDSTPKPMPLPAEGGSEQSKPQYRVSNMVTVTIRELTKVSSVLDSVVEAGANSVWGVSFGLDDAKQTEAEGGARGKAIADAKARAQALAQLAGVELGPVMSISEAMGSMVTPGAMRVEMAQGGDSTPISAGEVEVSY